MKKIIRIAYRLFGRMKRLIDDTYATEIVEDALGFSSMFVILFALTIIF